MKRNEIYKCDICGNIVELLIVGGGELVCCGQPMALLDEKTRDQGNEKHVPLIERGQGFVKVRVGDVPHPMEQSHYIQFIELEADGTIMKKYLSPDQEPLAVFETDAKNISAREYCNIHGLWKSK